MRTHQENYYPLEKTSHLKISFIDHLRGVSVLWISPLLTRERLTR